MRAEKIYNYTINQLNKIKNQETRVNSFYMLVFALIWRLSLNGKYLEDTLRLINEFDYKKNFGEENEDGKAS